MEESISPTSRPLVGLKDEEIAQPASSVDEIKKGREEFTEMAGILRI
jgi:hypothetical protein